MKHYSFPADKNARLTIPPSTLGYPDVETYRDLYVALEAADDALGR